MAAQAHRALQDLYKDAKENNREECNGNKTSAEQHGRVTEEPVEEEKQLHPE